MSPSPATDFLFLRDDSEDGPGLSKQNVIIIAVCSSFGAVFMAYFLFLAIRKCIRPTDSTPHPLPQPLAHHRQLQVAQIQQALPPEQPWFFPQSAAHHRIRPYSAGGSNASLLGSDNQALTPSSHPSIDNARELFDSSPVTDQHLPLPIPSASFLQRPSSRSSLSNSSDASCMTGREPLPLSPDSATPFFQRTPGQRSSMTPPHSRHRPLSMSSTHTYGSSRTARYGVPHAPHNQIQIVLPTPLASASNSREDLALRSRHGSDVAGDRRSVADPWISIGGSHLHSSRSTESLPEMVAQPRRVVRRHASAASNYPVLYEGEAVPPVPPLRPTEPMAKTRKLEKRRSQPGRS